MQEDIKNNRVTLDSNVLISAVKENEKYSRDCKELLSLVGNISLKRLVVISYATAPPLFPFPNFTV